jgi:hypothetical protein
MAVELVYGERKERETKKAILACNDYLRMGPGRSLQKLHDRYQAVSEPLPPTRRITTLKRWSKDFEWQKRAADYEAYLDHQKTEMAERRRRQAMEQGLALDYERVTVLKNLTSLLLGEMLKKDPATGKLINIWLQDAKQIGSGIDAERVDIEHFNAAIIRELRGLLDDLAKETGGRKEKHEFSGPGGGPIKTEDTTMDDDGRARRIVELLTKVKGRVSDDD